MEKKYTIGLDIGTQSVGWAVINNEDNKLFRKGRKNLWGVRLFEDAKTAETRRQARSTRRRFDRRRKRLKLLREEFASEIKAVDPLFYKKMQESFYRSDDKINKTVKITKDENQMVKEYYKKYPTIYHLRNALLNTNDKMDIRLVYLALHHIIKYRGNFLYSSNSFSVNSFNVKEKLISIFNNFYNLNESVDFLGTPDDIDYDKFEKSLNETSKNDKKQGIKEVLSNIVPTGANSEIQKLLVGDKFSINKLFELDNEEDVKISFKGTDYEDNESKVENACGELLEVIYEFKELYNILFLKNLFKGSENTSLSKLMVERYNKHKEDLKFLKTLIKYDETSYKKIFKTAKGNEHTKDACIYERYINNNLSYDDFIKEIQKVLEIVLDKCTNQELIDIYTNKVQKDIALGNFLPRITDSDNGKYPYQLNKDELIQIIEKQGEYYSFLKEKTNDGTYKIVRLLEFRIPYYVGPLNTTTNKKGVVNPNAWIKLKDEKVRITPYNFDEVVDKDASAEEFIKRMISHCTYILDEYAIPTNSILYSKFKVLNELKQISIDNRKISKELQEEIYKGLFLKSDKATITESMLKIFLKASCNGNMYIDPSIKGYSADKKFANNMKSYVDFFGEDGIFKDTLYTEKDAEEIIEWITIFEDKSILEKKVREKYKNLPESSIKKILNKNYSGWSELSEKLLNGVYYKDRASGINKSIMDLMKETDDNFMQILNNKEYKFQEQIDKLNVLENPNKISYELVEKLATSPANKRGIWQSIKIVEEIIDYIGYEPENISIEMARGEDKIKKRKASRKEYLQNIYNECQKNIDNYNYLKEELDDTEEEKFQSERLYLYFIQEGKSLYSGAPLDINELDKYEVDHIIPRTLIKDDSFDNKALVLREENQIKASSYILPEQYRTYANRLWWEKLRDNKLISPKKFYNLTRIKLTEDDINGFINRQIVETRQITKHVANIFNSLHKDTNVIYLNADLSHNYRMKNELFKFRDLNDYHHAHDAYLAAVLGEYKQTKLKQTDFESLKELTKKYIEEKKYKEFNSGYVINSLSVDSYDEKTGEITFDAEKFNNVVTNTLYQNDILVTKKTEIRTGEFYNQTKNKKGNAGVSLKANQDSNMYGSYTSLNPSYAAVVKYIKKNKEEQKLIGIPIFIDKQGNKEEKINYIKNLLNLPNTSAVEIIKEKIPFFSLLNWDGQICSLVGATDTVEVCNAIEFNIEKEKLIEWKYSLNYLFNNKKENNYKQYKITEEEYDKTLDEIIKYIILKVEKEYKLYINLLEDMKRMFLVDNLSLEEKQEIVKQMFILLKCNSNRANLKNLNSSYSSTFGRKHSRTIEHGIIINQSVTGLKSRRYEF